MSKPKAAEPKRKKPYLEFRNSCFRGLKVALKGKKSTLGRAVDNDIVLDAAKVDEHHLVIHKISEGFEIEVLDRRPLIFLNGKKVSGRHPLRDGYCIDVDVFTLIFHG